MALKVLVSSLDQVPEAFRGEYKKIETGEGAGKYLLQAEASDGFAIENVLGLKNTLAKTREDLKDWKEKVKQFGELTPEEAQEAVAKLKKIGDNPEEKIKEQMESLKKQLNDKHAAELRGLNDLVKSRDSEIESYLLDSTIAAAINKHDGNIRLLTPIVKAMCKVVRDASGKASVYVLQEDGKSPRVSQKSGNTNNMTIEEAVEILKSDDSLAGAFKGSGVKGVSTTKIQPKKQETQRTNDQKETDNAVDRLREYRRAEAGV